jgi:hypothetical protein
MGESRLGRCLASVACAGAFALLAQSAAAQGTLNVLGSNVGIGTTTPVVPMHVVKTTVGNANMFRIDNAGAASFELRNTAANAFWFFQADQDGTFKFSRLGTGGSEVIVRRRLDQDGATMFVDGSVQATNVVFSSARDLKTGFTPVDRREVLERLVDLPIETWRFNTEAEAVRHMGPIAEDFHAAFALGSDERGISTLDANGVALAAIQGLYDLVREQDEAIRKLQERLNELEGRPASE